MAFRHSCRSWNWKILLWIGNKMYAKENLFSITEILEEIFYIYINLMGWKRSPIVIKYMTIFRWIWYFTPSVNVGDVVQEIRRSFTPKFFISRLEKLTMKALKQCLHKFRYSGHLRQRKAFEVSFCISKDNKLGEGRKVTFVDCTKLKLLWIYGP